MRDADDKPTITREVRRWHREGFESAHEVIATEEPLEIRLAGRRFTITMRTPGDDEELVAGFLFAEGFVNAAQEIDEIRRVRTADGKREPNIVDVVLRVPVEQMRERLQRNFAVTSSCGLCGKTSIEAIRRRIAPPSHNVSISSAILTGLSATMRSSQKLFAETGGLHAAALFDLRGNLRALREDIGRHNAVDKIVGWALAHNEVPLQNAIVMVSGRLSFEIVQKVAAAGIPILAAVSAPSSLAVELAEEIGTTLIGFLRDGSFNVYTRPERVIA